MTTFSDDFERADGSLGSDWVVEGDLVITSGQVGSAVGNSQAWYVDALDDDQTVTVTLGVVNPVDFHPQWGVTVRSDTQSVVTEASYYLAALYYNDPDWLYLILSSSSSIDELDVPLGDTPAPGDTFSLSAVGSTITLKFNGGTLFTTTDTDVPSGPYAGFEIQQQTVPSYGTIDAVAVTARAALGTHFTPPSFGRIPTTLPKFHPGNVLMRHYRARQEGTNVYLLSDGTATETDPDSVNVFWHSYDGSPYVKRVFWGSTDAPYELTAAEATALDDAGYTVT